MKEVLKYVKKWWFYILMISYCIYDHNWLAMAAFIIALISEWRGDYLKSWLEEDAIEIKKWYDKYMNAKYGRSITDENPPTNQ